MGVDYVLAGLAAASIHDYFATTATTAVLILILILTTTTTTVIIIIDINIMIASPSSSPLILSAMRSGPSSRLDHVTGSRDWIT